MPNNSSAPLHVRNLAKSHAPLFTYLIFIFLVTVMVRFKVRVRVLGLGLGSGSGLVVGLGLCLIIPTSGKCRTASYLAMRHIWHDTGISCSCELE